MRTPLLSDNSARSPTRSRLQCVELAAAQDGDAAFALGSFAWQQAFSQIRVLYGAAAPPLERSPATDAEAAAAVLASAAAMRMAALRGGALLRVAARVLSPTPSSVAAPTCASLALLRLQHHVLQTVCVLYSTIDPIESLAADAPPSGGGDTGDLGGAGGGADVAGAAAAASALASVSAPPHLDGAVAAAATGALHGAARALAAAACGVLIASLSACRRGSADALADFTSMASERRSQHEQVQEYALRLLRHVASLEPLPPPAVPFALDAAAFGAAIGATLTSRVAPPLLRQLALSAMWAWLDASPGAADALATSPGLLPAMRRLLLAPLTSRAAAAAAAAADAALAGRDDDYDDDNDDDARARAAAALPAGGDDNDDDNDDAAGAAALDVGTDADISAWTPAALAAEMARELQAGAAGALWGCSSRVSGVAVSAMCTSGVVSATAALLAAPSGRASGPAARFCAAGALAGWLAATCATACAPPPDTLLAAWAHPPVAAAATSLLSSGVAALACGGAAAEAVIDTVQYDWKPRDLSEAVSALCRLLSVGAAPALCARGARAELVAGVAAWPLCILTCRGARVLSRPRAAHLCADARLVPALVALAGAASSSCAPAADVARRTLAQLAGASPEAGAAVVAALSAPLRDFAALSDDVALRCEPEGVVLTAPAPLLITRSAFFAALMSPRNAFAERAAEAGAAAAPLRQFTLPETDSCALRAFLRWAATGGAAVGSVREALTTLTLALRLLAPLLADAMVDAATAIATTREDYAALLRFGFVTDGPHAVRLGAFAAAAAAAPGSGGAAEAILAANDAGGDTDDGLLAVPAAARDALRAALAEAHAAAAAAAATAAAAEAPEGGESSETEDETRGDACGEGGARKRQRQL
jgi:hypothetical protein